MNKRRLIALGLICLGLVSCADSNELYDGDAYVAPIFKDNRYNHYDDGLKECSYEELLDKLRKKNKLINQNIENLLDQKNIWYLMKNNLEHI